MHQPMDKVENLDIRTCANGWIVNVSGTLRDDDGYDEYVSAEMVFTDIVKLRETLSFYI